MRRVLEEFRHDSRIKILHRPSNGNISAASNSALDMATGDFAALLDHDDVLAPHALYMVAHAVNAYPDADVFYSDEDKLDAAGTPVRSVFQAGLEPGALLRSEFHQPPRRLSHGVRARRRRFPARLRREPGLRPGPAPDCRHPRACRPHPVHSLSLANISGRCHSFLDTVRSAAAAARRAIQEHLESLGERATVTAAPAGNYHRVVYAAPDEWPKVSVIVPTRDHAEVLADCLTGLLERTDYPDLENS